MRVGIIPTTYGEPRANSFREQWVYSYRILRKLTRKIAPIPAPVLPLISTIRARGRVKLWREHGFVSPLEPLHLATVAALRAELGDRGVRNVVLEPAYEFRRPGLADALRRLRGAGCGHAVIVPMYISEGDFTHGMTRLAVADALAAGAWADGGSISYCPLADDADSTDRLVAVLATHCVWSATSRGVRLPANDWAVLLAAHGTVINPPPGVDNGLAQAGRVLVRLKRSLKRHFGLVRVGWLNHTKGGKWSTPAVPDALEEIRSRGFKNLVYFPWGFTTDNAETRLEGQVALAGMSSPFEKVEHIECVNAQPSFVMLLADRVCQHLASLAAGADASAPHTPGTPHDHAHPSLHA